MEESISTIVTMSMIIVVVAISAGVWVYTVRLNANRPNDRDDERIDELARSVDRLEVRMANMETIILDQEKVNVLFAEKGKSGPR